MKYRKNWEKNLSHADFSLPIDKNGECIFHSKNEIWKKQNNFLERFRELTLLINKTYDIGKLKPYLVHQDDSDLNNLAMNFEDFIFVKDDSEWLQLNELKFSIIANFTNSIFLNKTNFRNTIFNDQVWFGGTIFIGSASFDHVLFGGRYTSFRDVYFSREAYFENIVVKGRMILQNENYERKIIEINKNSKYFLSSNDDTNYSLENLSYNKNLGKLFNHLSTFQLQNHNNLPSETNIIFRDANISYFNPQQKAILLDMSKKGKNITILQGCNKYRFTKEEIILLKKSDPEFIMNLSQIFARFIRVAVELNVFVEFDQGEKEIVVRFFSDVNLTQEIWEQKMNLAKYWFKVLYSDPDVFFNSKIAKDIQNSQQKRQYAFLEVIENFLQLLKQGVRQKIIGQKKINNIHEEGKDNRILPTINTHIVNIERMNYYANDYYKGDNINTSHIKNSSIIIKSKNITIMNEMFDKLTMEIKKSYKKSDITKLLQEVAEAKQISQKNDPNNRVKLRQMLGKIMTKTSEFSTIASFVLQLITTLHTGIPTLS